MSDRHASIFIDTNVYLSFYGRSKEDLDILKSLQSEISANTFSLLVTEQVQDEFYRRREDEISSAMKKLNEMDFKKKEIPGLCKSIEEYDVL